MLVPLHPGLIRGPGSFLPRARPAGSLSRHQVRASCQRQGREWAPQARACQSHSSEAPSWQIGSYHYVSGVDASSSAALAAYINSLTYELEQSQAWFSTGKSAYKLKSGAYW